MSDQDALKVIEIIKDVRIGMFTTHAEGGLISRPLTVAEVTSEGDLWFFSTSASDIVGEIKRRSETNVSFAGNNTWVSVRGTASVVLEVEKKRELWNPMVEAFATEGPDSLNTVLIHVASDAAEYWENPGGAASLAIGWVKHKFTGRSAKPGDSAAVEL